MKAHTFYLIYSAFLGFIKHPITKAIKVGITHPNPTLESGIKLNAEPKNANNTPNTNEV